MAKNSVDNLSEEVKKGLLEKAEQGHWPTRAPVGYVDNVLSNGTFDRGSVCPTYRKPFDLFARASETGEWRGVWDDFRNYLTGAKPGLDPDVR